jgi:23S rRNA pseudouridine955/2504/2580 synthase
VKRIEVLYEDSRCLVLNKPAGLAVQGGRGIGVSLDRILAEHFTPRPLLVHRLDRDTSGLILAAKTRDAAAGLSRLFGEAESRRAGRIVKQYLAICAGGTEQGAGRIALDLEVRGRVKKSETRYRLLESRTLGESRFSVLEIELGSGRMHQIRRHLAMTGSPVLGDDKYGDFALNRELRKSAGLKRLLLHASRLIISDGGFSLDVSAPPPPYFSGFPEKPAPPH